MIKIFSCLVFLTAGCFLLADSLNLPHKIRRSDLKYITAERGNEIHPVVSGNFLYYCKDSEGSFDIYKKDLENNAIKRLTADTNDELFPLLRPGSEEIFFKSTLNDINGDLNFSDIAKFNNLDIENLFRKKGAQKPLSFIKDNYLVYQSRDGNNNQVRVYNMDSKVQFDLLSADFAIAAQAGKSSFLFYTRKNQNGKYTLVASLLNLDKGELSKQNYSLTFSEEQIRNLAISQNGRYLVYSVSSIENRDVLKKLTISYHGKDSLIVEKMEEIIPPLFMINSFSVKNSGEVYFSAKKQAGEDYNILLLSSDGFIPVFQNQEDYLKAADYCFIRYKNEVTSKEDNNFSGKLWLYKALYALKRAQQKLIFEGLTKEIMVEYFNPVLTRIADIYTLLEEYEKAESVFRYLAFKNKGNQELEELLKLQQIMLSVKRRKINLKSGGYESSEILEKLIEISDNSKGQEAVIKANLEISRILYEQKYYDSALIFAESAKNSFNQSYDRELYSKAVIAYCLAAQKLSISRKKINEELIKGFKAKPDLDLTIKLAKLYFSDFFSEYSSPALLLSEESTKMKSQKIISLPDYYDLPELSVTSHYLKGILYYLNHEYDLALEKFDKVSAIYRINNNNAYCKQLSALVNEYEVKIFQQQSKFEEAEGVLRLALKEYQDFNYELFTEKFKDLLNRQNLNTAELFQQNGKYEFSLKKYKEAFNLSPEVQTLRKIAGTYKKLGVPENFLTFLEKDVKQREELYSYGKAYQYLLNLKSDNISEQKLDEAIYNLNRALELNSKESFFYLTLSFAYESRYNLEKKLTEARKNRNVLVKSLDYLFSPLLFLADFLQGAKGFKIDYLEQAIIAGSKGLAVTDPKRQPELFKKLLLNLANNYYNYGEFGHKEALYYYEKILEKKYQFSSDLQKAIILERIGHCYFTLNDHEKCEKFYNESIKLYDQSNDRTGFLRTTLRKGLLYLTSRDEDGDLIYGQDAGQLFKKVLKLLLADNNTENLELINRNMAYAYQIDKEPKSSNRELSKIVAAMGNPELVKEKSRDETIYVSLFGLDFPVWNINLTLGSQNAEGFSENEEIELVYSLKVNNQLNLKNFQEAIEILQEKLSAYQSNNNITGSLLLYNQLGQVLYLAGSFQKAADVFFKGLLLARKENIYNAKESLLLNGLKSCIMASKMNGGADKKQNRWLDFCQKSTTENLENQSQIQLYNLCGILNFQQAERLKSETNTNLVCLLENTLKSLELLNKSKSCFEKADSLLSQTTENSMINKLKYCVDYNLTFLNLYHFGEKSKEKDQKEFRQNALLSSKEKSFWRYYFLEGNKLYAENQTKKAFQTYLKAEETLSRVVAEVDDYENYRIWQDDIRSLYDKIVELYYNDNESEAALLYAERYRSRIFLNLFSSRYLELKDQIPNIHLKKIRDNQREIVKIRNLIIEITEKDSVKYKAELTKQRKRQKSFEKELKVIFKQVREDDNTRLLQLVTIPDINIKEIDLYKNQAVLYYHQLNKQMLVTVYAEGKIRAQRMVPIIEGKSFFESYFEPFEKELTAYNQIFLIPDLHDKNFFKSGFSTLLPESVGKELRGVLSLSHLKITKENININNLVLSVIPEKGQNKKLQEQLEGDKPILFKEKFNLSGTRNGLDNYFSISNEKLKVSDLLSFKMNNAVTFLPELPKEVVNQDLVLLISSLSFSGVSQIVIDGPDNENSCQEWLDNYGKLIKKDFWQIWGDFDLPEQEQLAFARNNLRQMIYRGSRYYKKKRYRQAFFYFRSGLNMAEKLKDATSTFKFKDLLASCLKELSKHYQSALYYEDLTKLSKEDFKQKLSYQFKAAGALFRADSLHLAELNAKNALNFVLNKDNQTDKNLKLSTLRNNLLLLSLIYQKEKKYELSNQQKIKQLFYSSILTDKEKIILNRKIFKYPKIISKAGAGIIFILNNLYKAGRQIEAIRIVQNLENSYKFSEKLDQSQRYSFQRISALIYLRAGRYLNAEKLFTSLLDNNSDISKKLELTQDLFDLNLKKGNLQKATRNLSLINTLINSKNKTAAQRFHNSLALYYFEQDSLEVARVHSAKALELYLEQNDTYNEAAARANAAKIELAAADNEAAYKHLEKAFKLAVKEKNQTALAAAEFYKGVYYTSNPDSALYYHRNSLNNAIKSGDKDFELRNYLKLADFHVHNKDTAQYYLKKIITNALQYDLKGYYKKAVLKMLELNISGVDYSEVLAILEFEVLVLSDFSLPQKEKKDLAKIYQYLSEDALNENNYEKFLNLQNDLNKLQKLTNIIEYFTNYQSSGWKQISDYRKDLQKTYYNLLASEEKSNLPDSVKVWLSKFYSFNANTTSKDKKLEMFKQQILLLKEFQKEIRENESFIIALPGRKELKLVTIGKRSKSVFISPVLISDLEKRIKGYYNQILLNEDSRSLQKQLAVEIFSQKGLDFLIGLSSNKNDDFHLLNIFSCSEIYKNFLYETLIPDQNPLIKSFDFTISENIGSPVNTISSYDKIYSFAGSLSATKQKLVYALYEQEYLKSRYKEKAEIYSGEKALESKFKQVLSKSGNADSIKTLFHLALHAKASLEESFILFTPERESDNHLQKAEILATHNQGKDFILSACETAFNIKNYAEGKSLASENSLATSFLLTGSSSVIASRWQVSDLNSAIIIKRYFRYLSWGKKSVPAFNEAKRALYQWYSSKPLNWAGFCYYQ